MKTKALLLTLVLTASLHATEPLEQQFQNPPDSARPHTWWHWINGNVSKEGITADLEAMKQIGLAGAQIFSVGVTPIRGPVVFGSQEWRDLVKHSLSEAGIRLAMIGNIDYGGHPPGPVKMFTPEWKAATKHAMAEANK